MDLEQGMNTRKLICINFFLESCSTTDLVSAHYCKYMCKEPCMTSSQTGEIWMNEVLHGNPIRCVNAFRMHPEVFRKLCAELETNYGLKSSDKMSTLEKLGIFVYTLALGVSNRDVGERFQRSGETISRAFHEVLEAMVGRGKGFQGLARDIIKPKDPCFQSIPPQIINDKRYMPYFKVQIYLCIIFLVINMLYYKFIIYYYYQIFLHRIALDVLMVHILGRASLRVNNYLT